jgi:hypothetical protein
MPTEILERIIGLAIPDTVEITSTHTINPRNQTVEQDCPFDWEPVFIPHLLLVCKSVGRVARKILSQRVSIVFRLETKLVDNVFHRSLLPRPDMPADVEWKPRDTFVELGLADSA